MKTKHKAMPKWNLGLLYASPLDPQIEKDIEELESLCRSFAEKFDLPVKKYLEEDQALFDALTNFELIAAKSDAKPLLYFYFLRDIEADNTIASSQISLITNRLSKCENNLTFFKVSLGTINGKRQRQFLASPKLSHYKVFLAPVFSDAQYTLSVPEEKIMNLKMQPAYEMWISSNEKMLNLKSVPWKNRNIPLATASALAQKLPNREERLKISRVITSVLKTVAPFSEAEINAIVTNKKIDDDLRGFISPYESTVQSYRNDPDVVRKLIDTVTSRFDIAHRFYRIKAKLLNLKKLEYPDRASIVGTVKAKFTFDDSITALKSSFGSLNPKFSEFLDTYIANGQLDVLPRVGKKSGAYCSGSYSNPTFMLLNHADDFHSFTTMAHEFGHAFHGELSRSQGPLYADYSVSLAETASTLFESIARQEVFDKLSDKEKIIALHDKINDDIATIFRQIACFNYEEDIHKTVRGKGYMSKEELAEAHNKHMAAYLGPIFKFGTDDGYYFVHWSHIRRFFYVYSYAYGMLVSKALLRRYKADPLFWNSIETFLSAGGKASPEEILREIGIDVSSPGFFEEGLAEIEEDIARLEKLIK